jgi:hypothetical protein
MGRKQTRRKRGAPKSDPPASPSSFWSPARLKRVRGRTLALGALIVGAVVAYAVPRLLDKGGEALDEALNAPISVSVRHPGEYQTESFFSPMYLFSEVLPDDVPTNVLEEGGAAYYDWARQNGGVPGQEQALRITIRGRGPEPVIIDGIRARVLEMGEPLSGWFTHDRGCGGVDVRNAVIDLDEEPPSIAFSNVGDERPDEELLALTLSVTSSDVEVIDILAETRLSDVKWELEVLYSAAGEDGVFVVRDGGEPFEVTALTDGRARFYRMSFPPKLVRENLGDPSPSGMQFC